MSFSTKVKQEIFGILGPRHCRIAEYSALMDFGAQSAYAQKKIDLLFANENVPIVKYNQGIDRLVVRSDCCKRAYIRGAYLACGTMTDPKKSYHMEFSTKDEIVEDMKDLFSFFEIIPKTFRRKSAQVIYFKESGQISVVLSAIGAHIALMEFENCRVDKDVNNSINRSANAQAANADKSIRASAGHIRDIMDIQNFAGLSSLNENLAKVAQIRLEYPLASLEDIGKKLIPPISKSGVNHRLKKIAEIAKWYRNETEVYND